MIKMVDKSNGWVSWMILSDLNIIGKMLHYNWNNLMISAQLYKMKITLSAVPSNITNLSLDSDEV